MTYQCQTCGAVHEGLPDIGCQWPDPYLGVPESERSKRIWGTSDACVIDNEAFFIRGVILLPIRDTEDQLGLGVWVSQKRENFETYMKNYDTPEIGPFFGWLSNRLSFYERDTWALKTMAHFQGNGQRPLIKLEPCDHQLFSDYSSGITLDRAWELVHSKNVHRAGA
jgi:hypothetical protein